jgi:NADPH-dependent F420 reductase
MAVTIIGTGNMARGIGTRFVESGISLTLHGRKKEEAQQLAKELTGRAGRHATATPAGLGEEIDDEIVILAIPYRATAEVVKGYGEKLAGKILVDISNPVNFQTFELLTPPDRSAAEETAALAPRSTVLKAFNTVFAGSLLEGKVAGQPLDVFVAGDEAKAKQSLMGLINTSGMRALDAGPLKNARYLEGFEAIHLSLQDQLGTHFGSAIKIIP